MIDKSAPLAGAAVRRYERRKQQPAQTGCRWIGWLLAFIVAASATPAALSGPHQSLERPAKRAEPMVRPSLPGGDPSPFKARRPGASPSARFLSLESISESKLSSETKESVRPGAPRKIGFGRDVPPLLTTTDTAAALEWHDTPRGGKAAALSIRSPNASGIRLGVLVRSLPPEAVLRFYPQGAGASHETAAGEILETIERNHAAGDNTEEARTFWSPRIDADEATIEIELPPGLAPESVQIAIPRVSHFFDSPPGANAGKSLENGCNIDASCYSEWLPESNATAKIIYVEDGSSYLCTGTLLNDLISSGTPYFLTANHCVSSQTAASTLESYWFYRTLACDSPLLNPDHQRLTGGATLLYSSPASDTSFLRLHQTPPAGAVYAGWLANAPSVSAPVSVLHHPNGRSQEISFGTIAGFEHCQSLFGGLFTCSPSDSGSSEFLNVSYSGGVTEAGSSGSGAFVGIDGRHYLVGQLYGGRSSCENPGGTDSYGRFDVAYRSGMRAWLDGTNTPPPSGPTLHFEEPADEGIGSGVANIRGWAIAMRPIARVELHIDGKLTAIVPWGGTRPDVGSAYPGNPHSGSSGFSMAYNFASLAAGSHTFLLRAVDDAGAAADSMATFEVVRFPNSFISNPASVSVLGAQLSVVDAQTFQLHNVTVENSLYDLKLRWNVAAQGFSIVAITPVSKAAPVAPVAGTRAQSQHSAEPGMVVYLEEPVAGGTASGVGNIRGWAVSPRPITRVDLYLDGRLLSTVPYGGTRSDVANAYPTYPGSANSGYSMAFNFSNLAAGNHTLIARAVDDRGTHAEAAAQFDVVRFPSSFMSEENDVNLLSAGLTIVDANSFQLTNVVVQNVRYDLTLRWRPAAQAFALVGID